MTWLASILTATKKSRLLATDTPDSAATNPPEKQAIFSSVRTTGNGLTPAEQKRSDRIDLIYSRAKKMAGNNKPEVAKAFLSKHLDLVGGQ